MFGWIADSFRFAWALLYWNTRKSWFRLRRGKSACPCQMPSDSGRAFETGCDACAHWDRPWRFRRVCPLLVKTKDGLRCSADTADVRPFWGGVVRYYGGTLLAAYFTVVLAVFGFLRSVGYPISIVHVALPPLWYHVGQQRGWFYLMRAQRAFAAGRTNEGLLYLETSYNFDPGNYDAGLALAKAYQIGQPDRSNDIFGRLLRDHPQQSTLTAEQWFRALLARGDFEQLANLAGRELVRDPGHGSAWMRGLVFATRQSGDDKPLRDLRANNTPAAAVWHRLLDAEMLYRGRRLRELRAAIDRPWPDTAPPYTIVFRIEILAALGDPLAALDLLEQQHYRLDDEAWLTLRLECLAKAGVRQQLRGEFNAYLLSAPLTQPRLKIMCAQLIRHPDPALFQAVWAKIEREQMPFSDATAGGWFSLLCTAGAVHDMTRLHALTLRLRQSANSPFAALLMVEAFFRGDQTDARATSFLPFLPLPNEINYALIEKYPGPRAASALAGNSQ